MASDAELVSARLNSLYDRLYTLRQQVLQDGMRLFESWKPLIRRRPFLYSASNLAFYLALRSHDLRELQKELLQLGLSPLGRSEVRAIANLDAVIASLGRICGKPAAELIDYPLQKMFFRDSRLLVHNANLIFGGSPSPYYTHIMVTLPADAAYDYSLIYDLLQAGMDAVRINCTHDNPHIWSKMISYIHHAEEDTGRRCKIYMDIGGPKVRISGMLVRGSKDKAVTGDVLFLASGKISEYPDSCTSAVVITCSIPKVFETLRVDDPVLIDDGRIRGKVTELTEQGAYIQITYARPGGHKLKSQKSLNFPKTVLPISPLTEKDLQDLDFIAAHADAVGFSFVKTAADIRLLQDELWKRQGMKAGKIAVIAKIDTQEAVEHLPEIIVQAGARQPFGIMIVRGDLAAEVGCRRLSELQKEIL